MEYHTSISVKSLEDLVLSTGTGIFNKDAKCAMKPHSERVRPEYILYGQNLQVHSLYRVSSASLGQLHSHRWS